MIKSVQLDESEIELIIKALHSTAQEYKEELTHTEFEEETLDIIRTELWGVHELIRKLRCQ